MVDPRRTEVLGRAAEGRRRLAVHDALLAQAKVGQGNVPLRVQQDVLRLQVPAGPTTRCADRAAV